MSTFLQQINLFPEKNFKGKYCLSPFVQVNISNSGNVGMCGCATWQPTLIGNIFEHSLHDLLNGTMARKIRQSIIDGTYVYCNEGRCGLLRHDGLNTYDSLPPQVKWAVEDNTRFSMPHNIVLSLDHTCNLYCPSCRHEIFKNEDIEKQQHLSQILRKNLFGVPSDERIVLNMDTGGEIFASNLLLDFLGAIPSQDFPNLELDLLSNGLLAEKRWHRLGNMQTHVKKITVSFDSPDPATYEKLRRGGQWQDLVDALKFLKQKKDEIGMQFNARMVVQKDNFEQMHEFYTFSKEMGADDIQFQRIMNWGTFTSEEFSEIDVFDSAHRLHGSALEQLKQVEHLPNVFLWHGIPRANT